MESLNPKIPAKARRLGRETKGLKHGWLNRFSRTEYKTPVRDNTYHAAERGELPGIASDDTTTPLHHATSAPGILQTLVSPAQFQVTETIIPVSAQSNFTFKNQIQRTLLSSPINILLLVAPAGIVYGNFLLGLRYRFVDFLTTGTLLLCFMRMLSLSSIVN
ncbi:hypothetical protein RRF57_011758 [Xylaria bambusicola]|uniref:Uncharacterized protein n=1 Tax=Xylaria bambusicola TaxID=326684 RepID=A0AAN7V0Z1_9PEZI